MDCNATPLPETRRAVPSSGRARQRVQRHARIIDLVASRSYIFAVRAIGLKTLKNKLAEYVRMVAGGETVLITDRDRVVAELCPPRTGRAELLVDAQLAEMVRRGLISPPALPRGIPPSRPVAPTEELLAELRADRDGR